MITRFTAARYCAAYAFITILLLVNTLAVAADFSAPLVDLPKAKVTKDSVTIKAIVDDDVGVASVFLFYRVLKTSGGYTKVILKPKQRRSKIYTYVLPQNITKKFGIEYYVEARDVVGNVTQEPFPNAPKIVTFRKPRVLQKRPRRHSNIFTRGLSMGANLSYGNVTIDDPKGNTDSIAAPQLALLMKYAPRAQWQGVLSLGVLNFTLPYSENDIGQKVSAVRVDLKLLRGYKIFKRHGWIGAGIGYEQDKIVKRGNQENNALTNPYEDRNDTNLGLLFEFGYSIGAIGRSTVGVNGIFYSTLDNGMNGFMLGMSVLMR